MVSAATAQPATDSPLASFIREWVDEARVDLHLRTYYFDNDAPASVKQAAWAAGGWLSYQSGSWNGLSSQFIYFDSERLWGPIENDGTKLLRPGQKPIRAVGVLNLTYSFDAHSRVTGGWQFVDQPNVNRQDNRMVPNTFEGVAFEGSVGAWTYFAGYLTREKTREWDSFRDLAVIAAGKGESDGMAIGGVTWSPAKNTTFQLAGHSVQNVFNELYVDGFGKFQLTDSWHYGIGAQYMVQKSTGDAVLGDYSTWNAGIKVSLFHGPWILEAAYNQNGKGNAFKTPYGGWAGYQQMLVNDFDQAGQKAWMVHGTYDFKSLGAEGLTLQASYNSGYDALNTATGTFDGELTEFNTTIAYGFASSDNKWLKPLSVQLKYGNSEHRNYGTPGHTEQYRVIVNYGMLLR